MVRRMGILRRRALLLSCASAFAAALVVPRVARAADMTLTFDGPVPTDPAEHFFVPFDVPDGIAEIEILHDDKSDANILDWGLYDPNGWRGWGGGNTENAVVNANAASRSYVPGPIVKGTWKVDVGKAKIVASPAVYHIVVTLRAAATLAPQTVRKPYVPAPALVTGTRYYAGDLHVHSRESGDAVPTLDDIATFAKSRNLDFVEISDHNTITQDDFIVDAQSRYPDLLMFPGIEFTTYHGHANAIGATKWLDHKIGVNGATVGQAVDAAIAQGAMFSINHPALDIGTLCIGCGWHLDEDPSKVTGVEIETTALSGGGILFQEPALKFWETFLSQGYHTVGLGGGDDHRAGKENGTMFQSALGSPTTMVYADELSQQAIMDGIRKGHVVVKTDGPADPMVELTAGTALPGDTLKQKSAILHAKITGVPQDQTVSAHWVHNGVAEDDFPVTTDPFETDREVQAPQTGEDRWRFEVTLSDNHMHTITNHVFLSYDASGPDPVADAHHSQGGCAVRAGDGGADDGAGNSLFAAAIAGAALAWGFHKKKRRNEEG
jgi:hypothetical protein